MLLTLGIKCPVIPHTQDCISNSLRICGVHLQANPILIYNFANRGKIADYNGVHALNVLKEFVGKHHVIALIGCQHGYQANIGSADIMTQFLIRNSLVKQHPAFNVQLFAQGVQLIRVGGLGVSKNNRRDILRQLSYSL